jgi:hypothetical protein
MLRKLLFLLLITGLFSGVAIAQITLGPRFGINFMQQSIGSPYETYNTGTTMGGVINVTIKDMMAVQGELLFTQKGYREEFDGDNSYDEFTARYLEIPVFFNYSLDFARFKPFINAGPYVAFWQSGSYESKIGGQEVLVEDYEFTSDIDEDGYKDNRLDYGLGVGIGLLWDRIGAAGNLVLDLRYTKGFAEVNQHENPPPDYVARYNSGFTISLAYMFAL